MPGMRSTLVALLMLVPVVALAQVGHDPRTSPYRDLTRGAWLLPEVVSFGGSGGHLGIAPHDGRMYGVRAEIGGNRPLSFGLEFAAGTLQRLIVDADEPVASRVTGPVDQRVNMFGINLMLNLTGGKTWRGISPYVGSGAGINFAARTSADTSGWNYGRKFYFSPTVGVRWFLTRDIHLRAEARTQFLQVKYPESYREEPSKDPAVAPASNAVLASGRLKEWIASPLYTVSIGIPFPWPF